MGNLLRLIVELAEDGGARAAFRRDPDAVLAGFDDLCGEDVAAVLDIARVQVEPAVADRLTDTLAASAGRGETPRAAAVRSLLALCDSVEGAAVVDLAGRSRPRAGEDREPVGTDHEVPDHPPGLHRPVHLWAVGSPPDVDDPDADPGAAAPSAASRNSTVPLSPVPDPPGGFEFAVLELVELPHGLPDEGIEPGAQATIVAVHREPELSYEIEISGDDGGRRFLGVVPTSAVGRIT